MNEKIVHKFPALLYSLQLKNSGTTDSNIVMSDSVGPVGGLEAFHSILYPGTMEMGGHGPLPMGLTRIRGHDSGIACRMGQIPKLRIFVGIHGGYPRYDGMAIDSSHVSRFEHEVQAMEERRSSRERRTELRAFHFNKESTDLRKRLTADTGLRKQAVHLAKSAAGLQDLQDNLDPGLALRIDHFVSGRSLLDLFHEQTIPGPSKLIMSTLRGLFPPDQVPTRGIRRNMLVFAYIMYRAQQFEISETERIASVARARLARLLIGLCHEPPLKQQLCGEQPLTPADLEGGSWRDQAVYSVNGLPWIIREHIFRHVSSGRPWHPVFVADRLVRSTLFLPPKRQSGFVTVCVYRFINTPVCWYRKDPFAYIPRDILEIVCTFVDQEDMTSLIDASRSLVTACCHWFRRWHATDPANTRVRTRVRNRTTHVCDCGNPSALDCSLEQCGTCCGDEWCNRHRRNKARRCDTYVSPQST